MKVKKIAIGCDHAGFPYKDSIVDLLIGRGIEIKDFGTHSAESVDYPDFVHPVAEEVESGRAELGIVLCGSGNGVAMTANKHKGIRAAVSWSEEISRLAREHNDANVLAIPVRFVNDKEALEMVNSFIGTDFEGGRHARRVKKISNC
ncbi:MAG: ribose 5-phosphate isomerase B [Saprospiraceae bacterium]|nr:ribose 5-phosphate isomerase B [Saprospiraceae bacterium]